MRSLQWYKRGAAYHPSPGAIYRKICENLWDIKKVVSAPTEQVELPFQFRVQSEGEEW